MLCPSQHSDRNVKFLQKSNLPFVLIGRYFRSMATDYVCSDDRKGGFLAANYLLDRGYADKCVQILFDKIENNTVGYAQTLINVAMCEYTISQMRIAAFL